MPPDANKTMFTSFQIVRKQTQKNYVAKRRCKLNLSPMMVGYMEMENNVVEGDNTDLSDH